MASGTQTLHRFCPTHRTRHLRLQRTPDFCRITDLPRRHIGNHRHRRTFHGHTRQRHRQFFLRRLHEPTVVSPRHLQRLGHANALRLRPLHRQGNARLAARQHNLPRSIKIRHIHITLSRQLPHRRFLTTNHRRHRSRRLSASLIHKTTARRHQMKPVDHGKRPRRRVRRKLAQRKPRTGRHPQRGNPLPQSRENRQTMQIQGRLTITRPGQNLRRTIHHDRG